MVGFGALARKIFGNQNDRQLKAFRSRVDAINALEAEFEALSDEQLRAKTNEFRAEYQAGKKLDDLLIPAFAVVREASKRSLGMRHFDVQLIGGMVLHEGKIAEMKTGEGKTLVATLPIYLNALAGEGVHSVTVNDYLAQRDAAWMGEIYTFLGLTVGVVVHGLDDAQRKVAYDCDITYGVNNEFGFDYLRDNMKHDLKSMVQRKHFFAIVDEVDSILVDEARTPLIISGPLADRSEFYNTVDAFIPLLNDEHYELDEKLKSASFTDAGNEKLEELLSEAGLLKGESLYDMENVSVVHHLQQALRAHKLFQKDKDYIVRNGEVVLIDEFTGRMMPGRRLSEGLHQAIEAREKVTIHPENQTLASVTFQNYFRMYGKLAGMTGTAATEAEEFGDIYGLSVVEIPTNKEIARADEDDEVYRTVEEKYNAIILQIEDCHERDQPVLVGTTSIEKSEYLADQLKKKGFKQRDFSALYHDNSAKKQKVFQVLNARYHEQEAQIIAQAGVPGAVTIATNMAGRGTDIQLGGNLDMRLGSETAEIADDAKKAAQEAAIREEVATLKERALEAGGLYVIGTERHESRRIDNQLRGRSGRQGDPGHSKFYLSLQDDLMRIFGSDRMDGILKRFGLQEGEAIVHPWINKSLETAQKKVEARNFDARKNILKYDDVMNDQRKVIFEQRIELMSDEDVSETIKDMRHDVIDSLIAEHIPEKAYADEWDVEGLHAKVEEIFGMELAVSEWAKEEGIANEEMAERLRRAVDERAAQRAVNFGDQVIRYVEKTILLQTLDSLWREHLSTLDDLRSVIGFRGYGQRDPLNEYKSEAFALFETMLVSLRTTVTQNLFRVQLVPQEQALTEQAGAIDGGDLSVDGKPLPQGISPSDFTTNQAPAPAVALADSAATGRKGSEERDPERPETWGKVGRNEPCPCGSGKKFKHCHGALV